MNQVFEKIFKLAVAEFLIVDHVEITTVYEYQGELLLSCYDEQRYNYLIIAKSRQGGIRFRELSKNEPIALYWRKVEGGQL
jgi:hypothetical protein